MNRKNGSVTEYLKKPYARVLTPDDESGTCTAEIIEFPGCVAQGNTPEEAYSNLESVAESWLQAAQAQGLAIPEPSINQEYSGKIALRLPRSLHRQAVQFAAREGISLNQFLVAAVAEKTGASNLYAELARTLERQIFQRTIGAVSSYQRWQAEKANPSTVVNFPKGEFSEDVAKTGEGFQSGMTKRADQRYD